MKDGIKQYVLSSLKEYRRNIQQISLLQYELTHCSKVSDTEIIEAMVLSRCPTNTAAAGTIADKTLHAAIKYEEKTTTLNNECINECITSIIVQLNSLETKINRLNNCVAQLEKDYAQVIRSIYFESHSLKEVATEMHVSERTIQRYRDIAINELVLMYELLAETKISL